MASWGMARRVAGTCMSSVVGGAIATVSKGGQGTITYLRFPPRRNLHFLSQKTTLFPCLPINASPLCTIAFAEPRSAPVGGGFPRPAEIDYQKELANSVSLIGHINRQVDLKYLDSGKILAHSSIRVKRPSLDKETVFFLQFWDELAEIAAAHLKKEDRVYVSGSVWVESYVDKDNEQKSICKVVARDLKFVGSDYRDANATVGEQLGPTTSLDEQWKDYFANPSDYWDNRGAKRNPRGPDFKHKVSGVSLWIDDRRIPSWVKAQFEGEPNLDGRRREHIAKFEEVEKLWQAFFANPSEWWDNRTSKKNSKYPDFKNKSSGEVLWIVDLNTPSWVSLQLTALDAKGKQGEWSGGLKERTPKTSFEEEDFGFF